MATIDTHHAHTFMVLLCTAGSYLVGFTLSISMLHHIYISRTSITGTRISYVRDTIYFNTALHCSPNKIGTGEQTQHHITSPVPVILTGDVTATI